MSTPLEIAQLYTLAREYDPRNESTSESQHSSSRTRAESSRSLLGLPTTKELLNAFKIDEDALRHYLWYGKPPVLHYGFGIDFKDVINYHEAHQLRLPSKELPRGTFVASIENSVLRDLRYQCRFHDLDILPPSGKHIDHALILSLYDSHTIYERELADEEEEAVVKILQDELPVTKEQSLRWFYPICQ
ncbi:hypothetical protein D9757_012142 [Collybiopsis confluens]|uniref:Uncharacterized protein n=1 Tax=Collybiopsis confluens TaxID=2823264 RepID=A0A8H5LK35_9AGAR|nr:hypothetical protein D9757_012142 [Collybiopsis confluens]